MSSSKIDWRRKEPTVDRHRRRRHRCLIESKVAASKAENVSSDLDPDSTCNNASRANWEATSLELLGRCPA